MATSAHQPHRLRLSAAMEFAFAAGAFVVMLAFIILMPIDDLANNLFCFKFYFFNGQLC